MNGADLRLQISGIVGVVVKQFGNVSKVRTVRGYSFAPVPLKEGSWLCMETKRDGVMRARVIVPPCETRVLQADDGALHLGVSLLSLLQSRCSCS